jgi:hypothetical protein
VIEQCERAADGAAGQQVAGFVLLERARAAADQLAGLLLGEAKFLADAADLVRRKQPFGEPSAG